MKEESKIVEILAEMLLRTDRHEVLLEKLVDGQGKTNLAIGELRLSNMRIVEVLDRHEKLFEKHGQLLENHGQLLEKLVEGQNKLIDGQNKNNLEIGELKQLNIRMAEAMEKYANHEERIQKLEQYIMRKAS